MKILIMIFLNAFAALPLLSILPASILIKTNKKSEWENNFFSIPLRVLLPIIL